MKTLAESTITSKEQLTLPLAVRRVLGVTSGDTLVWRLDDDGHVLVQAGRPYTLHDIRSAGAATRPTPPKGGRVAASGTKAGIIAAMRQKHARD